MPLAPNSAMLELPWNLLGGQPRIRLPNGHHIDRPHVEWYLHHLRWRWLIDSLEGGEVYRMAVYGFDIHGLPVRNMIRHKREYPSIYEQTYSPQTGRPPGTDPASQSTDDDYELRRARTPVPGFLSEVIEAHLSKIYSQEVERSGPDELVNWWGNVDGRGTKIDDWFSETVAPLLLACGCIDIIVDRPKMPDGIEIRSKADERFYKLDTVVANYILPENMVWWELTPDGQYEQCLVREVQDDMSLLWRYWNKDFWIVYDRAGAKKTEPFEHGYGVVPIVRLFDRRRYRMKNIGLPRYEIIAELQREYYNRDSELVLSDSTQAHPLLQGPDDYVNPDGTIPLGPNWLLPMKGHDSGTGKSYQGFSVVDFPKGAAESLRMNKLDLREAVDRHACLTKPAGASGSNSNTVSQSGVSKQLDAVSGANLLTKIARMLGRNEAAVARLAMLVMNDGIPLDNPEDIKVIYPGEFNLLDADELANLLKKYQFLISSSGNSPSVEGAMFGKMVRQALPGMSDDKYEEMDGEVATILGQGPQPEYVPPQPGDPSNTPNTKQILQSTLQDQLHRSPGELIG